MKKILTHLTVIVFLIAILIAGGCKSATAQDDSNDTKEPLEKVTIYVMLFEDENGEKHLKLSEFDNPDSMVIDSLHVTDVDPGTKVVWMRATDSGIKKFERIFPVNPGEILPEEATTILFHKRYRARVPDKEIEPNTKQEYLINYVPKGENGVMTSDPYLRIED